MDSTAPSEQPQPRYTELLPARLPQHCIHAMRYLDNTCAHWRCVMCLKELPGAEHQ